MERSTNPLIPLGNMKDIFLKLFLQDECIQKLIMPEKDDVRFTLEQNWTGGTFPLYNDDGSIKEMVTLPGHCFDMHFPPDNTPETQAFLCLETQITYVKASVIDLSFIITTYAGNAAIHMSAEEKQYFREHFGFAGNRADMTAMAVHGLIMEQNLTQSYGIGKVALSEEKNPVIFTRLNDRFYGKSMTYHISIMGRPNNPLPKVTA